MKKIFAILLILVVLVTACSQQGTPVKDEIPAEESIGPEVGGLDNLDNELNLSELDALDQEFNFNF